MPHPRTVQLDVLVIGGGVAGLWALNRLADAGFAVALVEQDRLGSGQTIASQGMIHGGIKYALGGTLTRASEAIAAMPDRWRACVAGRGEIDLSAARRLSDDYWMWSNGGVDARLSSLFASKLLRGRVERVAASERPPFFADPAFRGQLYRLADFVFDTPSLLRTLAAPHLALQLQVDAVAQRLSRRGDRFRLATDEQILDADRIVLTAGAGNGALLQALGADQPTMQLRPLHQVCIELDHPHPVHAHCITGIRRPEPRMTVTSHPRRAPAEHEGAAETAAPVCPDWTWYLGGAIATDGVERTRDAQIDFARSELAELTPWVDLSRAHFSTLRIDRAEPLQPRGGRPDEAFVHERGGVITAWPTKLSLAPHLGDRVLALLGSPDAGSAVRAAALREALVGARRPGVAPGFETLAA